MASGKAGKGARKRLLPERKESWELGNGKGQGHPLPTHSFLSPPPPSANTWHGHKQGLCSLPLGQDLVKEAKSRQQGVGWGRAVWATPYKPRARGHYPLGWAASCSLPTQHATDTDPLTRQCCCRIRGSWHNTFLKGSVGQAHRAWG